MGRRLRLTGMRILPLPLLLPAVLLSACSGSSSDHTAGPSQPAIRGARLASFSCQAASDPGRAVSVSPVQVVRLRLCPVQGNEFEPTATVRPAYVGFSHLLDVLGAPDEPRSSDPCPEYADLQQTIVADTPAGAVLVHIPVDGCEHYQRPALDALQQARMRDAAAPPS